MGPNQSRPTPHSIARAEGNDKTCATCKHLGPADFWPGGEHRRCLRIPNARNEGYAGSFLVAPACIADGKDAELRVLPTFGCALWEGLGNQ